MGMQSPGAVPTPTPGLPPTQPLGGVAAPSPAPLPDNRPAGAGQRAWGYPRWSFLALILFNGVIVACFIVNLYYTTHACSLVPTLCQALSVLNSFQILLAWLLFCVLWLLTLLFGLVFLENNAAPGPMARWLLALSQFAPVRPLLMGAGGGALLLIMITLLQARLSAPALELGGPVILLAVQDFWQTLRRNQGQISARGQRRQVARQADSPWYILRNLVPFTYLFPNRAPSSVVGGAGNPPVAPTAPVVPTAAVAPGAPANPPPSP